MLPNRGPPAKIFKELFPFGIAKVVLFFILPNIFIYFFSKKLLSSASATTNVLPPMYIKSLLSVI